jgi:hypothetical protein
MKTSIKSMAAIIMAALSWTSCIDTEVAPEVKAIREQQVALIQARVRLAEAQAEEKEILNAYNEANYLIQIAIGESNLAVTLENNKASLITAQKNLQAAQLQLEQAVDALEQYMAQHDLLDATVYLTAYENAATALNTLYQSKLTKEAELIEHQAILAEANNNFALAIEAQLESIAEDSAELLAKEGALADLMAATDASDEEQQEMLDAIIIENVQLSLSIDSATAVKEQKALAYIAAQQEEDALGDEIAAFDSLRADTVTLNASIDSALAVIDHLDSVIMDNEEWILDADSTIDANNAEIEASVEDTVALVAERGEYEEALEPYLDSIAMAAADTVEFRQDSIDAVRAVDIARGNYNASPSTETQDALTAAQADSTAAVEALADARVELDEAIANAETTGFQDDIDAIQDEIDDIADAIETNMTAVETATEDKATYEENIAQAEADIADTDNAIDDFTIRRDISEDRMADLFASESAYEEAGDDLIEAEAATAAAFQEKKAAATVVTNLDAQLVANKLVETALKEYQSNLDTVIDTLKGEIATLRTSIATALSIIASQEELVAGKQAAIVKLEDEIAQLDVRIEAQEAIVAERLRILNEALGL